MMKNKNGDLLNAKGVCRFLKANDNFLILAHASPDGDTLGCAAALCMGLRNSGKKSFIMCSDAIPEKYSYFFDEDLLKPIDYKTVVAVDIATEKLLGNLEENFSGKVDLCIDHHISNTRYAKKLYLDSGAAAACESVYDIIKAMKWRMTDKMAAALYTGISTDTGSFKYSSVTAKTHKIAAELNSYNINAHNIAKLMFDTKSRQFLELERMILEKSEFYFDDKCFVLSVTTDMLTATGCSESELESIASISRCVEGVVAGVTIKQKDEQLFKISLRTYEPLDASKICMSLGGGGHRAAAGCTVEGTLEEVKEKILAVIKNSLEEQNAGISAYQ